MQPKKKQTVFYGSPHTLLSDVRDRAEGLCQEVAANDLAGRPVYVLLSNEISDWPRDAWLTGLADSTDGAAWQRELGGRWRGPGCSMIVDRSGLLMRARQRQYAAGSPDSMFLSHLRCAFYEVTVHELAHWCVAESSRLACNKLPTVLDRVASSRVRKHVLAAVSMTSEPFDLPTWYGHGLDFIRACCHFACRAQRLGARVHLDDMCGSKYGLSAGHAYAAAFAAEIRSCGWRSVAETLQSPPPAAALDLWASNTTAYATRCAADAKTLGGAST